MPHCPECKTPCYSHVIDNCPMCYVKLEKDVLPTAELTKAFVRETPVKEDPVKEASVKEDLVEEVSGTYVEPSMPRMTWMTLLSATGAFMSNIGVCGAMDNIASSATTVATTVTASATVMGELAQAYAASKTGSPPPPREEGSV